MSGDFKGNGQIEMIVLYIPSLVGGEHYLYAEPIFSGLKGFISMILPD